MENTNEKSIGQQLQEELTWKFPAVAMDAPERIKEAYDFVSLTRHFCLKPRQSANVSPKLKAC